MATPLPSLSPYASVEERWLAAVVERLDVLNARLAALLAALAPPPAPAPPTDLVALQEPRPAARGPGRPRKGT